MNVRARARKLIARIHGMDGFSEDEAQLRT